jgi:diguanylate cyclase (GGDEF)-like protein
MINSLRSFDVIGRWGGEEFVVILVNVAEGELFKVADRFRQLVENSRLTLDSGEFLSTTVSIGVTKAYPGDSAESIIERADKLMYKSKRQGRNCVSLDEPESRK